MKPKPGLGFLLEKTELCRSVVKDQISGPDLSNLRPRDSVNMCHTIAHTLETCVMHAIIKLNKRNKEYKNVHTF